MDGGFAAFPPPHPIAAPNKVAINSRPSHVMVLRRRMGNPNHSSDAKANTEPPTAQDFPMTAHLNSNWASGAYRQRIVPIRPAVATEFEELVHQVGLEKRPDLWSCSPKLVKFAKLNRNKRYIPESFLDELGLDVILND